MPKFPKKKKNLKPQNFQVYCDEFSQMNMNVLKILMEGSVFLAINKSKKTKQKETNKTRHFLVYFSTKIFFFNF